MAKSEKTKKYLKGSAREIKFPDGGALLNIDLSVEEINSLPKSPGGYIKITVSKRQGGVDKYGNTHSVYLNEYVPEKKADGSPEVKPSGVGGKPATFKRNDLPF